MKLAIAGLAALSLGLVAAPALAQQSGPPVEYDLSFENAAHHEARITVTYRDLGRAPVRFEMSRSSPGRYAVHEFAKNVSSVSAVDGAGRPLSVDRTDPYGWTVGGHDGTVAITYTLFGDRGDGTYAQINPDHAHLNMPATLMWARGYDERPVTVRFRPSDPSWTIATQLAPTGDPQVFTAPNLQYLMDSPTELADLTMREWSIDDNGVERTVRIALHHTGTEAEADEFAARARRVVDAQIAIFGDAPDFDYGTYTFLADYLPWGDGDGMEHRNSTVIADNSTLAEAKYGQIGTLSHEFFHAWNVERIRPRELEPFDFTRANPTPSLWFAEGFTNYYGPLAIRRAGVSSVDEFLGAMGGQLSGILNTPARAFGSPQEMSLRAPFVDAAASIDPNNPNIFTSYYPYGAVIALGLDLTLRDRFEGITLDSYMRHMWKKHGMTGRPYTPDDLRIGLGEVTGDPRFADAFFAASIERSELPDFAPLLAQAGVLLQPKNPGKAWAGRARLDVADKVVTLASDDIPGMPLYEAGLGRGDEIVSLGGARIDSPDDWSRALARARPGDKVEIRFIQRGRERSAELRLVQDPTKQLVRVETTGVEATPEQLAFREAWLGR
ncbi:M61 family metallopeptidase [Brevundimonas sp. Root1279]|uniref:M61 family metallopeptidase n=1 Tax=Brevundimonas sp. Root1279 TaxID=1736443 RepID=UPI0006FEB311|nr:PDZ domain-containing protein [Brevundimonas sp. Root1279]KQW83056.1 peptidase M61 [Brevundimonas sp. Root1279]